MANRIVLNTVSYHGKGAIKEIAPIAQSKGWKHIFVCSDPDLIKFGVTSKVTDLLNEAKIPYRYSCRGYNQLCNHRCSKGKKVCLR